MVSYKNLTEDNIRMIINFSNSDRKIIQGHINKIRIYFENKIINSNDLEQLINSDKNELFENIRDAALNGNKNELAKLLNYFIFTKEDAFFILIV